MSDKIGFIGLGEIGLPIAINLQKSGFKVFAYDTNEKALKTAQQQGIICCDSIKEVAENSDGSIISLVRTAEQTKDVIFGEQGITSADKRGLTIIIMSTLDPTTVKELDEKVEKMGFHLVDAPVSGGKSGAETATLSIMTSGAEDVVKKCNRYFEAVGENIFYFGKESGAGQSAKLVNNLIVGINVTGMAEGLRFGQKYSLPQDEILKLLSVSTGSSWVVNHWGEVSKWKPEATLGALYKDLMAIIKECSKNQLSLPLGALTSSLLIDSMDVLHREIDEELDKISVNNGYIQKSSTLIR
ncbi:3-hydroxyisobutyrate dehydrogenase [Bacillus sp. OV166]|uniref:NAD(P)-dependent oxidoreductase n=1 Tax=Bacillus sp. OV166 TaxID=1882763 RepID=UPI000A2AA986|nr:NAD(P)-dependent oxidoreductase [Bacillus sp. OV166]SMQ81809.1 3-hydroxyisobutyrate dehydrogenase [Bacillus sp. OV166]